MKVTKEQHLLLWTVTFIIFVNSAVVAAGLAFGSPAGIASPHQIWIWIIIQFGPSIAWGVGYFSYLATMPSE